MTHPTRFTLIALAVLMSVTALGLLAGCDKHRVRSRRDDYYDPNQGHYDQPRYQPPPQPRRHGGGFRQPPPRPVPRRGEDRDDFEDRMEDWEDDHEDWKDDYEDWQEDRRDDYEDRYDH